MALSTRGFNSGTGRSGGIRWSPDLSKFAGVIKDLRDPIYDAAWERLRFAPQEMLGHARITYPWKNRTGTAWHGLSARRRRGASYMSVSIGHSPHTEKNGFNYGMALEGFIYDTVGGGESDEDLQWMRENIKGFDDKAGTETFRRFEAGKGTYAVILPTIEFYGPYILPSMKGILEEAVRKQL